MELHEIPQGTIIDIYVRPRCKQFQVKIEDDEIVVFCREAPMKGSVNRELTKELSKRFKRRVEIVSGFSSRQKKVLIAETSVEEIEEILSAY